METRRGIPVSAGVAIGTALMLGTDTYRVPKRSVAPDRTGDEVGLQTALAEAAREARHNQQIVTEKLGPQYGAIFAAHASLIDDHTLSQAVEGIIRARGCSAEYALSTFVRGHVKALESLNNATFAARAADLTDIEKRILRLLLGRRCEHVQHLREPVIVLAHDLTPSETASLDPSKVMAFATEAGGRASHTAIIAGALEIPAVVGLGRFLTDVSGGDLVIVDGTNGALIINPDSETLERYRQSQSSFRSFESGLTELRDLPAVTLDGTRILLMGNIEFPSEAQHCLDRGADGVGLYRTEFLYLGRTSDPTEEEHLEAYQTVLRILGPHPVVIRTIDLGADKFSVSDQAHEERNPFLGLRSIRFCLQNLTLFKTQLRAILRASAAGNVRIMFPMVSTVLELRQCKMILADVKEDLESEGIAFDRSLPVGTMIEVPSAAIMAEAFAREANFFSIGTNDLVQYTLAADRTNETVASLYSPGDPSVLRLIEGVVRAAQNNAVAVNVCGEMSGDPIYTMLLLGMGLRQLSVTPHNIPEIKKIIRSITLDEAVQVAREALRLETARDVNHYLRDQARRFLPEAAD